MGRSVRRSSAEAGREQLLGFGVKAEPTGRNSCQLSQNDRSDLAIGETVGSQQLRRTWHPPTCGYTAAHRELGGGMVSMRQLHPAAVRGECDADRLPLTVVIIVFAAPTASGS